MVKRIRYYLFFLGSKSKKDDNFWKNKAAADFPLIKDTHKKPKQHYIRASYLNVFIKAISGESEYERKLIISKTSYRIIGIGRFQNIIVLRNGSFKNLINAKINTEYYGLNCFDKSIFLKFLSAIKHKNNGLISKEDAKILVKKYSRY